MWHKSFFLSLAENPTRRVYDPCDQRMISDEQSDKISGEQLTIFRVFAPIILAPDVYQKAPVGLMFLFIVRPCHRRGRTAKYTIAINPLVSRMRTV